MTSFHNFLLRNNVVGTSGLPLVHSTPALHVRNVMNSNRLVATDCDVFVGEKLNYFFVGRPAYKHQSDPGETPDWELPCCFIFEFEAIKPFSRVFPFDTGAFNGGRYPSYIDAFPMAEYEVGTVPDATERIIGAFFGTADNYFKLQPKTDAAFSSEFSLGAFDYEIRALHRLALERTAASFDDRRLTIEVQTSQDIELLVSQPLAVIAPSVFLDDPQFAHHVTSVWNAQPISYPLYPLNVAAYYAAIYERVHIFYQQRGLLP